MYHSQNVSGHTATLPINIIIASYKWVLLLILCGQMATLSGCVIIMRYNQAR